MAIAALERKVLSWKEAEELFRSQRGYASADYYALEEYARLQGFTITHIGSYQMMMRVKDQIQIMIEEGQDIAQFQTWASTQGLAWSRAYTELVFRMAVFGSFSQARFEQINHPEVVSEFDILFYDAVNDARTRPEHSAMSGKSWKRAEFPSGWWPQNGFNCRCEVRAVTQKMEKKAGLTRERGPLKKKDGSLVKPDPGFQKNYLDRESQRLLLANRLRNAKAGLGR